MVKKASYLKCIITQLRNFTITRQGFTLIELLVVIGIIGILTVLSVANFMSARERAKDAQKKSDLKQIQNALELYKMDQNPVAYPSDGSFLTPDTCWSSGADCTGNIYINKTPSVQYYYSRSADSALEYTLAACLANKADKDGQNCDPNDEGWDYPCSSDICYILNEP